MKNGSVEKEFKIWQMNQDKQQFELTTMKYIFKTAVSIFLLMGFVECEKASKSTKITKTVNKTFPDIFILPLGDVKQQVITDVCIGIESFYGVKPQIEQPAALSEDLLAKSKTRYEANKILSRFNSNKNLLIITDRDIAIKYKKHNSEEWGIMGLGYRPGKTCVVSTFRLKRNANDALFKERLIKICIHEIGHNLGLDHCKYDPKCLMNDANGTISQVDKEEMYFCLQCRKKLER